MHLRTLARNGLVFLLPALMAGCASPRPNPLTEGGGTLPPADLEVLYQSAQDPRRYFITITRDDDGPVFDGAHRLYSSQVASIPFDSPKTSPIPVFSVQGNSMRQVPALIDTTSAENWADLRSALTMKMVPLGPPALGTRPLHVNDSIDGFLCVSERLEISEIRVETALFFVRNWRGPLEILDRGITTPRPGCVLGMRFLRPFAYARFDFPNRSLTLSATQPYRPNPGRLVASIPYLERAGALTVEGRLNGETVAVVLDTAGQYGLAIPRPTPDPLQLSFGDWELEPIPASDSTQVGVTLNRPVHMGLHFLAQYSITIDLLENLVHFESPSPGQGRVNSEQ